MTQKTWGPFTGNHLTAIAGFILLAIAVPSGLWAADPFSNVAIYDPQSGETAVVDDKQLIVGDGNGALTVDGSVIAATEVRPADLYRYWRQLSSGFSKAATPPPNKALIIKTLIVNVHSVDPIEPSDSVLFHIGPTSDGAVLMTVNPGRSGNFPIPLDPGLSIPQGSFLWARTNFGLVGASVFVIGNTVPASAVPAGCRVALTAFPNQKNPAALGDGASQGEKWLRYLWSTRGCPIVDRHQLRVVRGDQDPVASPR